MFLKKISPCHWNGLGGLRICRHLRDDPDTGNVFPLLVWRNKIIPKLTWQGRCCNVHYDHHFNTAFRLVLAFHQFLWVWAHRCWYRHFYHLLLELLMHDSILHENGRCQCEKILFLPYPRVILASGNLSEGGCPLPYYALSWVVELRSAGVHGRTHFTWSYCSTCSCPKHSCSCYNDSTGGISRLYCISRIMYRRRWLQKSETILSSMYHVHSNSYLVFWNLYLYGKEIHSVNIHFKPLTYSPSIRSIYSHEFSTFLTWFCYGVSWSS